MTMSAVPTPDADARKGAIEQDSRAQHGNTSLNGQLPHRNRSPLADTLDTDFPEPGMSPEHTGQHLGPDEQSSRQLSPNAQEDKRAEDGTEPREQNPEGQDQDQDPGDRQKRNQGDKKDDSLAA